MSITPHIAIRNKSRIAQQFSRAASAYNSAADVKPDIAFDTMAYVALHYKNSLDIGCGLRRYSQQLATRCDNLVAMDLAFSMMVYATQIGFDGDPSICWLQGNADCLPVADNSVKMIFRLWHGNGLIVRNK